MSRQPSVVLSHPLIKNLIVIASFFLLAFTIRYPDFFYYKIDWDESTYILMAQDILDGHLPLTHYWDVKPPLLFLPYALFILIFGKSIVAIRFLGLLCVVISAIMLWYIGKKHFGDSAGFWGGVFYVVCSSTIMSGQATMSEHIASVPFCLALYILLVRRGRHHFLLGVLLGVGCLIRLNMVYFSLMVGVVIFFSALQNGWLNAARCLIMLWLGLVVLVGCVSLVYAIHGHFDLLKKTVWDASLAYTSAGDETAVLGINPSTFGRFLNLLRTSIFSYNYLFWFTPVAGVLYIYLNVKCSRDEKMVTTILVLLFAAMLFAVAHSGWGHWHYLISLFPMMAVMGGVCLAWLLRSKLKLFFFPLIIASFLISLQPLIFKYQFLYLQKKDVSHAIVDYLSLYDLSGRYVYFATHHIGYWFTGAKIPMKYAHPSIIDLDYITKALDGESATTANLIRDIFLNRPLFIIMQNPLKYLDEEHNRVLNEEIRRNYVVEKSGLEVIIYRREDLEIMSTKWWRILQDQAKNSAVRLVIEMMKNKSQVIVSRPAEFYVENVDLFLRQNPESPLNVAGIVEMLAQSVNDFQPMKSESL